jgi:hypothetical protein
MRSFSEQYFGIGGYSPSGCGLQWACGGSPTFRYKLGGVARKLTLGD